MWYGVLCQKWFDVECITHCHCISHLIASLPPHFIVHHSIPYLTFQATPHSTDVTPSFLTISNQYHSHQTIPLCNTILQIAPYWPHHILHCTPFSHQLLTYHTTPHFMYSTPHLCIEPPHLSHHTRFYKLHRISHAPHILHSLHHI